MTQLGEGIEAIFLKGEHQREGFPPALLQLRGDWVPQECFFLYQWDGQGKHSMPPLGVFRPLDFQAAARCVKVCSELGIPLTPRGWGTGQAGGAVAARGGVILLMGHFQELEELDTERGWACIQAGASLKELSKSLESTPWSLGVEGPYTSLGAAAAGLGFSLRDPDALRAEIIDGRGQVKWVSRDELMGSEGMRGVIIRIEIDLERRPEREVWTFKQTLDSLPTSSSLKRVVQRSDGYWLLWRGEPWRVDTSLEGDTSAGPPSPWQRVKHGPAKVWLQSAILLSTQETLLETAHCMARDMGLELEWEMEHCQAQLTLLLMAGEALVQFRQRVDLFVEEWVNVLEQHEGQLCGFHGVGSLFAPFQSPFWPESYFAWIHKEKLQWDPKNILAPDQFFPTPGKSLERRQVVKRGENA